MGTWEIPNEDGMVAPMHHSMSSPTCGFHRFRSCGAEEDDQDLRKIPQTIQCSFAQCSFALAQADLPKQMQMSDFRNLRDDIERDELLFNDSLNCGFPCSGTDDMFSEGLDVVYDAVERGQDAMCCATEMQPRSTNRALEENSYVFEAFGTVVDIGTYLHEECPEESGDDIPNAGHRQHLGKIHSTIAQLRSAKDGPQSDLLRGAHQEKYSGLWFAAPLLSAHFAERDAVPGKANSRLPPPRKATCSFCFVPVQWTKTTEEWSCKNFDRCKRSNRTNGPGRWVCSRCDIEVCAVCKGLDIGSISSPVAVCSRTSDDRSVAQQMLDTLVGHCQTRSQDAIVDPVGSTTVKRAPSVSTAERSRNGANTPSLLPQLPEGSDHGVEEPNRSQPTNLIWTDGNPMQVINDHEGI